MKTFTAGLASYKTTVVGALLAGLLVAQEALTRGVTLTDPQTLVAITIALLSFLMRDADVSSEESKLK